MSFVNDKVFAALPLRVGRGKEGGSAHRFSDENRDLPSGLGLVFLIGWICGDSELPQPCPFGIVTDLADAHGTEFRMVSNLDLGLPSKDGLSVLNYLRKHQRQLPVIISTARDGIDERVDGLDLGADDYLTKPFDTRELLARIRAILRRRGGGTASPTLSNGSVQLELSTREATANGTTCRLTAREFALL